MDDNTFAHAQGWKSVLMGSAPHRCTIPVAFPEVAMQQDMAGTYHIYM